MPGKILTTHFIYLSLFEIKA